MANGLKKVLKNSKKKANRTEELVKGIINSRTVNILVAEQSKGKSMLAMDLVKNLVRFNTHGETFLERPVVKRRVKCLYISTEMNEQLLAERFQQLGIDSHFRKLDEYLFVEYTQTLNLESLNKSIEETKAEFVVIDVLNGLISGLNKDLNSYQDMNDLAGALRTMFPKQTFLLVHHMNKKNKAMGSVGTLSAMDTRIEMLTNYIETQNDEVLIYQKMHIYGKSVQNQNINVVFKFPYFSLVKEEIEDGELDKPLAKLIEYVISNADINNEQEKIVGTFQQVAAKAKMIERYQWSPRRFANLLKENKEVLEGNGIYYELKRKKEGYELIIWYDSNYDDVDPSWLLEEDPDSNVPNVVDGQMSLNLL